MVLNSGEFLKFQDLIHTRGGSWVSFASDLIQVENWYAVIHLQMTSPCSPYYQSSGVFLAFFHLLVIVVSTVVVDTSTIPFTLWEATIVRSEKKFLSITVRCSLSLVRGQDLVAWWMYGAFIMSFWLNDADPRDSITSFS